MEIKDIQGNVIVDVPITQSAVKTEELMKQYSIALSWNAISDDELPLGSYIEYEGVRYSLLEPYSPEQRDEATFEYRPVFQHPIMRLSKALFFFYTYSDGAIVSKELDWSLTDNPANFMSAICDALLNELGENWTYEIASDLPASTSLSFSNTDIFSALNSIAGAFETEWWFDYANKVLYLSKAQHGSAVTLEVGQNIGVPQVTPSKEGYYTRFYVFGSTRNIDQSYAGANVNSIVNRRLTLDPAKYPNGYIDIRQGLTKEEILPTSLVFDDIYPRSSLTISDVKVRMMWRLDDNSQKVQIGTDSEGNPVYDQYAIWYFKIPGFAFSKNLLISGKALSAHFNSGPLNGREFELTYHDKSETLSNSDGTDFVVEAGDYEINFVEEGTFIIPAITGLVPVDGNSITLFNIIMPEEYKASAYAELEEAVRKRMAQQEEDRNNYTFESNKVAFYESNPNLSIGRLVTYKNGAQSISTRVIKLETQLDYPFEQRITVGNAQIKGTIQTLKEEVVSANENIDLIAAINKSTEAFTQSLQKTQKAVQNSLAKWATMWTYDKENDAVRTTLNLIVEKSITFGGIGGNTEGGGSTGSTVSYSPSVTSGKLLGTLNIDGVDNRIYAPSIPTALPNPYSLTINGTSYDGSSDQSINITAESLGALTEDNAESTYATITALNGLQASHNVLRNEFDSLNKVLNDDVSGKINTWNEVVNFLDEYSGSQDLATILSGMNADIADRALQSDLESHINTFSSYKNATDKRLDTLESMWFFDPNNAETIRTIYNVAVEKAISFGGYGEGSTGSGGITEVTKEMVISALGYTPYSASNPSKYATEDWVTGKLSSVSGFDESKMWTALGTNSTAKKIAANYIGDLSGKYLSIQGGEISGNITRGGAVWGVDTSARGIFMSWDKNYLHITNDGAYYNWQNLIHSGNIGSQRVNYATSAGDADTLDGVQYQNILERSYSCTAQFKDTGWYRIAMIRNVTGANCTLYLYQSYNNNDNCSYIFNFTCAYGTINITQVGGATNTRTIDKIRVSHNGSERYIDIHLAGTANYNHYYWTIVGAAEAIEAISNPTALANNTEFATAWTGFKTESLTIGSTLIEEKEQNNTKYVEIDGNLVVKGSISFGDVGNSGGTSGGLTSFQITIGNSVFTSEGNNVTIPTSSLRSALSINNVTNLAARDYLTDLSSNTTNAVSLTIGGTTKYITTTALKTSLGLGSLAYKSSLTVSDIPALPYLPSNGGTISGGYNPLILQSNANFVQFSLNTTAGYKGTIQYNPNYGLGFTLIGKGGIYISESGIPTYYSASDTAYTLIHSDNIKDYNAGSASKLADLAAYKAWGQTFFEGGVPKQVSGVMSNVDGIKGNKNGINIGLHPDRSVLEFAITLNGKGDEYLGELSYYSDHLIIGNFRNGAENSVISCYDNGDIYVSGRNFGVGIYPTYTLDVNGTAYIRGNIVITGAITFGSASDRRLKDNIQAITDKQAIAVLQALNPVTFTWNSTAYELGKLSGISDGFIADEYEKLIPNSGRDIWANYRAINYERATGYLVKGWQKHQSEIERLKERVRELEKELKQYRRA